jgi:hypothetical protein
MVDSATNPSVWLGQGDNWTTYNQLRADGYARFLTDEQKCRLERIRAGTLLFDGCHRQYYLDERRTRFNFPPAEVQYMVITPYSTFNVLGLISQKGTDLLFGQEPLIAADDDIQQGKLEELARRCRLYPLLRSAAVDATYQCEAFLESIVHVDGLVYLKQIAAEEIFGIGELGPDWQYESYVRYSVKDLPGDADKKKLLLEITYKAGSIERRLYLLNSDGSKGKEIADLRLWDPAAKPLSPLTITGIEQNTITWIPNMMARGRAVSDYDGAIDLQDKLNAQDTQVDNILAKHAEPVVARPKEMADADGNARSSRKLEWYDDPERISKYIQRTLDLEPAFTNVKRTLNNILIRTETSPVLLGLKEGAAPDAYKKVRLEAFNSITKAARKAAFWTPGIQRALTVCQDLEQLNGGRYDRVPIGVHLRDGIPVDAYEQAQTQALLIGAGAQSVKGAVEERIPDPPRADAELAQIEEERAKKAAEMTPSVLLGGEVNQDNTGTDNVPPQTKEAA